MLPDTWIDVTAYGGPLTYVVKMYGLPVVSFPIRRSYVVELWSDWEWEE